MAGRRRAAEERSRTDLDLPADRVLPHNLEAEKAVLGAIMVDARAFERAGQIVSAPDFFRRAHQHIFRAAQALIDDRRVAVDLVTIKAELERMGELDEVGGPAYISALTDGVPRGANVSHYAAIVKDHAIRRALIRQANDLLLRAYAGEEMPADLLASADRVVLDMQREANHSRMVDLREVVNDFVTNLMERGDRRGQLLGIDTGFPSLNDITGGWQPGDMTVVAARPSMGKTAFVLNTAVHAAMAGKHVGIFSLEMRRSQLEYRMLANLSSVPLSRITSGYLGELDYAKITDALGRMQGLAIHVDDRAGQTAAQIRSACRRLKAESGLDLAIIDYVQLIKYGGDVARRMNRSEELGEISRSMKILADDISAPILLLSQLRRADTRWGGDRKPRLEDLRESGALEQDADNVLFLHRKNHRESGPTSTILEKQRNGPTGTLTLTFDRDTQTFTDGGEEPAEPEKAEDEQPKAPPGFGGRKGWRKR